MNEFDCWFENFLKTHKFDNIILEFDYGGRNNYMPVLVLQEYYKLLDQDTLNQIRFYLEQAEFCDWNLLKLLADFGKLIVQTYTNEILIESIDLEAELLL